MTKQTDILEKIREILNEYHNKEHGFYKCYLHQCVKVKPDEVETTERHEYLEARFVNLITTLEKMGEIIVDENLNVLTDNVKYFLNIARRKCVY